MRILVYSAQPKAGGRAVARCPFFFFFVEVIIDLLAIELSSAGFVLCL